MIWGKRGELEREVIALRAEVKELKNTISKFMDLALEAVVEVRSMKASTHRVVVTSQGDISKLEKELSVIPGMTNEDFESDLQRMGMDVGREDPESLV